MLRSVKNLRGFEILAVDGAIGSVDDLYFDDQRWAVRFLVVDTGTWLSGRRVLISPPSIAKSDWTARTLSLSITQSQVRNSPDINTHKPVSRQYEATHFAYYGYPYYWGGTGLWGPVTYPAELARADVATQARIQQEHDEAASRGDFHLRSSKTVLGYHLQATDGELGHVEDLLIDDESWAIRYLVVDTSNWWFGKQVLVAPDWVQQVSWPDSNVTVDVTRQQVKSAPEYDPSAHTDRQWEEGYYAYYERPGYWLPDDSERAAHSARSVAPAHTASTLVSLKEHDELDVSTDDRDPRGWQVVAGSDGEPIGKVDDLIADTSTMKVRYLDVDLEGHAKGDSQPRHILLPIGHVTLSARDARVVAEGVSAEDVTRVPRHTSLPVAPGYDDEFRRCLHGRGAGDAYRSEQATASDWSIGKRKT